MVEFVLLPAAALAGKKEFVVERRDAEPLVYTDIQQLKDDYTNDIVCATPSYLDIQTNTYLVDPSTSQARGR